VKSLQLNNLADAFSKISIFIFFLIVLRLIISFVPLRMGEFQTNMITTISLEKHFSMFIYPSDIAQARIDYPDSVFVKDWEKPNLLETNKNGIFHSFYFGTYSLACIPVKKILNFLSLKQSYAFSITNALLYFLALFTVYKKLKLSRWIVFILILLLIFNPALFMIFWASTETFIFSFIVISLVFLSNRDYKKSALFASLASTLNPSICIYVIVIALLYLIDKCKNSDYFFDKKIGLLSKICYVAKSEYKDALIFSLYFIPSVIPFIYNLIVFRKLNPLVSILGTTLLGDYFYRFYAYFFDLNFGFFPYQPIVMCLFFILLLVAIYKRNFYTIIFSFAFLGTVAVFSLVFHINCGMSYISRYGSWSLPLAIFFVITQFSKIISNIQLKRLIIISLMLSALYSFFILNWYYKKIHFCNYVTMLPIAEKVLDSFPSFYNPYPYTFISRVNHVDGGFFYKEPVIYCSNDGYVKKILATPASVSSLLKMLYGNAEDMKFLQNKIKRIQSGKGFSYIDFDKSKKMMVNYFSNGTLYIHASDSRLNTLVGARSNDNAVIQTTGKPGYLVFGPYMGLNVGRYKLIAKGKLMGSDKSLGLIDVVTDIGRKSIMAKELLKADILNDSTITTLEFTLDVNSTKVEFRIFVKDGVSGYFSGYELMKVDKNINPLFDSANIKV
jgi:hypothetical protein